MPLGRESWGRHSPHSTRLSKGHTGVQGKKTSRAPCPLVQSTCLLTVNLRASPLGPCPGSRCAQLGHENMDQLGLEYHGPKSPQLGILTLALSSKLLGTGPSPSPSPRHPQVTHSSFDMSFLFSSVHPRLSCHPVLCPHTV
jgi:hypothetical protein